MRANLVLWDLILSEDKIFLGILVLSSQENYIEVVFLGHTNLNDFMRFIRYKI